MNTTCPELESKVLFIHNSRAQYLTLAIGFLWVLALGIVMPMKGNPPEYLYWPGQIWLGSMLPLTIGSLALFLIHGYFLLTRGNWGEQGLGWKRVFLCLAWPVLAVLGGIGVIAFMERSIG